MDVPLSKDKITLETLFSSASSLKEIQNDYVDLVVTSPPYPMVEMWDGIFSNQDNNISKLMEINQPQEAFEKMHNLLDCVWEEVYRVLKPGGIVCINIGDAVRTCNDNFCLYSNHSRILNSLSRTGFTFLPDILWHKQTNAPNKFMGSGMLPVGAYVTYEHEYVLIVRKGLRRNFNTEKEKRLRRESAFFWEERNLWFSDIWYDIKGASQENKSKEGRLRSAAFPFELAHRLILMFSIKNDIVLDPFLGTGTTLEAAAVAQRNAIGIEIDESYQEVISKRILGVPSISKKVNKKRINAHIECIDNRMKSGKKAKYKNLYHDFFVVTSQETDICLNNILNVKKKSKNSFEISYSV